MSVNMCTPTLMQGYRISTHTHMQTYALLSLPNFYPQSEAFLTSSHWFSHFHSGHTHKYLRPQLQITVRQLRVIAADEVKLSL